jgi:hypothetical protein
MLGLQLVAPLRVRNFLGPGVVAVDVVVALIIMMEMEVVAAVWTSLLQRNLMGARLLVPETEMAVF